jgi:hypothetical protein
MTKTSTMTGKGWLLSWLMSSSLQQALLLLLSPPANDSYHLAVLPLPSLLQRGKDEGTG